VRALALTLWLAGPALADDWVTFERTVDDATFYFAVACAAPEGEACRGPLVHWPAPERLALPVALRSMDGGPDTQRYRQLSRALNQAIDEINGTGADLRLVRDDDAPSAITVWDSTFAEGDAILWPDEGFDGSAIMEGARVHIWWNDDFTLYRATILFAADLAPSEFRSVMLEEMTQSLGLLTDLEGQAYAGRSIFDEGSNGIFYLQGQDAAALRLHYPPE
jgi:hypothetical protein